tara:strand:+ start:9386 stop:14470 length:5085 start_codon:yes stop_codon:yes gene_type:complete
MKSYKPFKIVHAYPSKEHRIQYRHYIFVGNVNKKLEKILESISELTFLDTLASLSKADNLILIENYGIRWWRYIFLSFHLRNQLQKLDNKLKKRYKTKFGTAFVNNLNWADAIKVSDTNNLVGGNVDGVEVIEEDSESDDDEEDEDEEDEKDKTTKIEDDTVNINTTKTEYQMKKDKLLFERVVKPDKKKIKEKVSTNSFSSIEPDEYINLQDKNNIYLKIFIYSHFIYEDDTIKTIKEKLCVALPHDKALETVLIPKYTYTWATKWDKQDRKSVALGFDWKIKDDDWTAFQPAPPKHIDDLIDVESNTWLSDILDEFNAPIRRVRYIDQHDILYRSYEANFNEIYFRDILHDLFHVTDKMKESLPVLNISLFKIYYPGIHLQDIDNCIYPFSNETKTYGKLIWDNLQQHMVLSRRSEQLIHHVSVKKNIIQPYFLTQGSVNFELNESISESTLRTIFNFFKVDETHPSLLFHPIQHEAVMKIHKETLIAHPLMFQNWLEHSPYGLSMKVLADKNKNKYASIFIRNNIIECRLQWSTDESASLKALDELLKIVTNIIAKFNKTPIPKSITLAPSKTTQKYNFLHTSQKINIKLDHNKFSNLLRLFYPYLSLVIAPGKKIDGEIVGKFGTYARYKRVNNYQSQTDREKRILTLVKNYNLTDSQLKTEVANSFNITEEAAMNEIREVKKRHQHLFYTKASAKSASSIPRYKDGGIALEIQGKVSTNLKILGAKTVQQLEEIGNIMGVIFQVYDEIYNYTGSKAVPMINPPMTYNVIHKTWLSQLNKIIAERKDFVQPIMESSQSRVDVKRKTAFDRERLKGWARICQGVRQASPYLKNELVTRGFKLDEKRGIYVKQDKRGSIDAIKLENEKNEDVYWSCDTKQNELYIHIGFAKTTKKNKQSCLPCCFKKNQSESASQHIRNKYNMCMGKNIEDTTSEINHKNLAYILQKAHLTHNRLGMLPKYLDMLFNYTQNKTKQLDRNNQLISAKSGYFFLFGTRHHDLSILSFIEAISIACGMTFDDCRNTLEESLKNKKVVISLSGGKVYRRFLHKDLEYNLESLSWHDAFDLVSLPGVLHEQGFNIFTFSIEQYVEKQLLDKDKIIQNITPFLPEYDKQLDYYEDKPAIFLCLQKNMGLDHFNPIVLINKETKQQKKLGLDYIFEHSYPLVQQCIEYWKTNGLQLLNAKRDMFHSVLPISESLPSWVARNIPGITGQIIDSYYRCAYLVIDKKSGLIPVHRSSILTFLDIIPWDKLSDYTVDLNTQLELFKRIQKTNNSLDIQDNRYFKNNKNMIISLSTSLNFYVPLKPSKIPKNIHLLTEFYDADIVLLNNVIEKGSSDETLNRVAKKHILKHDYIEENFRLFLFHFSYFITKEQKADIVKIISSKSINSNEKEKQLYTFFSKLTKPAKSFWVNLAELPDTADTKNFYVKNYRKLCFKSKTKDTCDSKHQCHWYKGKCMLAVWKERLDEYLHRLAGTIISNSLLYYELTTQNDMSFSNMVDPDKIMANEGELLFREGNPIYFRKKIAELLDKKSHVKQLFTVKSEELNKEHPIERTKEHFFQLVYPDDLSLYRSIANCLYWDFFTYMPNMSRNLGYFSELQDVLALTLRKDVAKKLNWKLASNYTNNLIEICTTCAGIIGRDIIICSLKQFTINPVIHIKSKERNPSNLKNSPILILGDPITKELRITAYHAVYKV